MHPSFFKQFLGFFLATLRSIFGSFSAVFFGFLFPIIFVCAFGLSSNSGDFSLDLGFVQTDNSSGIQFENTLSKVNGIKLHVASFDSLKKDFQNNSLDAIVQVDPSNPNSLNLFTNKKKVNTAGIAAQTLNSVILNSTLAENHLLPQFTVVSKELDATTYRYIDYVLPGLIGFSLITSAIQGLAFSFLTLKKTNALKRIFATPAKPLAFIMGQSVARIVFALLQVTILLVFAMTFFQYSPIGGAVTIAQMYIVVLLGILVFQGFGFIIAGIANTQEQANPLAQLVTLPQFMLGGTFFAVTSLPNWFQPIAKIMPLYSFNEAMRGLSLDGHTLLDSAVWSNLIPLGIWLIVVYLIAVRVFKIQ